MTNPYEAFNISDDEEDQFVQSKTTDKTRKSIHFLNIQLIRKEDNLKNKVKKLLSHKMSVLMLKSQLKTNNQDIKMKDIGMVTDLLKEFLQDTHLIEEVELVDKTDQEKMVEDIITLVPKMNSLKPSTNNLKLKSQLKQLKKFQLLNKRNQLNHQNQLLLNTIKAKVLISAVLDKKKLQLRAKSMLNGLKKKS